MKEKKMKKLTLNQTWTLCLRMWRWIDKMVKEGSERDVETLKRQWFRDNGFESYGSYCFFCEFATHCKACPGKLVDPYFNCFSNDYTYREKPMAFYKELLRLNQIRKGKK